ncbi:MAG: MlaD family protein [Candidatus Omnitrophica bacterium]|nr:MlaD family protein [Candidatus Omnitrophota bacterium]
MESVKAFEVKVGMFILIGVAILFIIVFSIGDINISKRGYHIKVNFNFASGIGPSAPVRLSGVGVGNVQSVKIVYSEKDKKSHAEVEAWIQEDAKIEEDAEITINTLGLLGEKYLEIYPGTPGKPLLKNGDIVAGKDPVVMEKLTENLVNLSNSATVIVDRLKSGEGTIGNLLTKDKLYTDIEDIMANIKDFTLNLKSTGANFKDFSEDLKRHPWKLLSKPRGE